VASWPEVARRIRVPLGFAFAALYVYLARPTPAYLAVGTVLVVLGLVLRALASGHVRKNETLTTTGPYAYTRNPLYLGSLVLACGFAVAARSWWIAAGIVVFFLLIYVPVIRAEEAFLRKQFPEFEDYAHEVPPLLPRLTPRRGSSGSFSWDLYWKHREYNAALGAFGMLVIVLAKMYWRP
jgi:protein-S-isoprenylcysteine O-methyltransferase Ste14